MERGWHHRTAKGRGWANSMRAWLGVLAVLGLVLQLTLAAAHIHIGQDHSRHSPAVDSHGEHGHGADEDQAQDQGADRHGAAHPFHASTTDCQDGHEPLTGKTGDTNACALCLALWHAKAFLAPVAPACHAPEGLAQAQVLAFEATIFARQNKSVHGTRAPPAA